jgi:hydrogenase maturation protease
MTLNAIAIGVGNPYRHDDGVGPAVVARLAAFALPGLLLAESSGEATELIELWDGADLAIVIDAVRAQPPHPGRVHRLSLHRPPDERARAASSHGIDLGEAVELARVLGRLPARLVIYAIEAADIGHGAGLSPAVSEAAERVAREIDREAAAFLLHPQWTAA